MTVDAAVDDKARETAKTASRAMLAGDRVSRSLGIEFLAAGPGRASLAMVVTESMLNGFGSCHGGALFTFADTALSCACNSRNQRSVAHHCSIVYLRPGKLGDRLIATAVERSRSDRIGIYDVSVVDGAGATIAEFFGHARGIGGSVFEQRQPP
jgi:acyl-CoA thioesterase